MQNGKPTDVNNIRQAKAYLRTQWESGCECPVCGQNVKLYKRKITSSMAYGLVLMAKARESTGQAVFHIDRFLKEKDCPSSIRGDMAKLRYWGFILQETEPGMWLLTKFGYQFATGRVRVPRYVEVYNRRVYGQSEEKVSIQDALQDRFSIVELLGYDPAQKYDIQGSQIEIFNEV